MFNQGLKICLVLLCVYSLGKIDTALSAESNRMQLPSCNVTVTADRAFKKDGAITYSGNVRILVGFAQLRLEKVTLVKKANGQCELVAG